MCVGLYILWCQTPRQDWEELSKVVKLQSSPVKYKTEKMLNADLQSNFVDIDPLMWPVSEYNV